MAVSSPKYFFILSIDVFIASSELRILSQNWIASVALPVQRACNISYISPKRGQNATHALSKGNVVFGVAIKLYLDSTVYQHFTSQIVKC